MANVPPPMPPRRTPPPDNGLAIASLVTGIASIPMAPCMVGGVLGVIGIITGVIHLSGRTTGRPMAGIGVILSILGIVFTIASVFMWIQFVPMIEEQMAAMEDLGEDDFSAWVGVRAPEMTVETLDGETIRLSDLKGKRVIVDVFQPWDPDCEAQIESLNTIRGEKGDAELVVLGITASFEDEVREFLQETPCTYPVGCVINMPRPFMDTWYYPTTFYIDRNGVIDAVEIDHQDLGTVRQHVAAGDFAGEVLDTPRMPKSELTPAEQQFEFTGTWMLNIDGGLAICTGDWDNDGNPDLLVSDDTPTLHIVDADGKEVGTIALPEEFEDFDYIEIGRHGTHEARLLGLMQWGNSIAVANADGSLAWTYKAGMGANGAHWGDLDGDGSDEMIVGMNGFSGVHAVTPDGDALWKVRRIGNVWGQAVIDADGDRPALIFASEAGGSVYVFDREGTKIRSVRPGNNYTTAIAAAVVDGAGRVQVIGSGSSMSVGGDQVVAFDEFGAAIWAVPTDESGPNQYNSFVAGDIDADGELEWWFHDLNGNLVVVTPDGLQKAMFQPDRSMEQFCVLKGRDGLGLLVTMSSGGKINAFRAAPAPQTSEPDEEATD